MDNQKIFTVSEINQTIKHFLQSQRELQHISVKGEISNYSRSGTGHIYFSLKDNFSIIRCTFFLSAQKNNYVSLKDGLEVIVSGNLNVYEPNGTYSINVLHVETKGKGELLQEKELLRKKLFKEGLFDPSKKKPLPKIPLTIGIATALGGAAVYDMIKIIRSRNEKVNILIAPCLVQGEDAPASIIGAIRELNNPKWKVDVIIAGRGGGSEEDLQAFDNEEVVRAFFDSRLPIVSAVGHEIDNVLSDLAADVSAPTPTAAAEMVTPNLNAELEYLDGIENRIFQAYFSHVKSSKEKYKSLISRYVFQDEKQFLYDKFQKLDELVKNLHLIGKNYLAKKQTQITKFEKLPVLMKGQMEKYKHLYKITKERLENFSPLGTLKRGYAVVRNLQKDVIHSINQIEIGENLEVILNKGKLLVEVKGKSK